MDEIARVGGKGGIATGQFDTRSCAFEGQPIENGHRVQDRFQFMKAVSPLAEDVEQQIDFAGRLLFQPQCVSKRRKRTPGSQGKTSPPLKPRLVSVAKRESESNVGL